MKLTSLESEILLFGIECIETNFALLEQMLFRTPGGAKNVLEFFSRLSTQESLATFIKNQNVVRAMLQRKLLFLKIKIFEDLIKETEGDNAT